MDVTTATRLDRYELEFDSVFSDIHNCIEHIRQFVEELQSELAYRCCDVDSIKNIFMPIVNTMKTCFERIMEKVETLNNQVSRDLEVSEMDKKTKKDTLKEMEKDIACLNEDLKGKTKAVNDAKEHYENAKRQLSSAKSVLSKEKKKLKVAKSDQEIAVFGGVATAIVSLVFFPVAPAIAAVGVAGGLGVELTGLTVMEESVKLKSSQVEKSREMVEVFESSLKGAEEKKKHTENQLQTLEKRTNELQENIKQIQSEIEKLRNDQKIIAEFNETLKLFYTKVCVFCGTFNVLRFETDGGYSLDVLKKPTRDVCNAMSELVQWPIFQSIYGQSRLDSLIRCQIDTEWLSIEDGSSYTDLI